MDHIQPVSECCSSDTTMSNVTAEETASYFPASMVVGGATESGTDQMLVINQITVPETFQHHQSNSASLALSVETLSNPSTLQTPSVDPFRRLQDISAAGDVPVINHIGVFVKGDGSEEPDRKPEDVSDQYQNRDLDSPLVPMPECGSERREVLVLVGGGGDERSRGHTPQDTGVSYSQECTEDVDSSYSYQLGKHWEKGDRIGQGISGTCYISIDWVTRRRMVVKQISNEASRDDVESEVEVMQDIRHENIVQFYGATRDHRNVNIFMELMEGGSVDVRLRKGAFGEDVICHYSRQLMSGVCYLHWKGVVHRDLKGGNLLTDLTGRILKIADFGAAARIVDRHKFHRLAGTYPYMAPEVVRAKEGRCYSAKCDVWSVGCVVIEMATTRPPWVQENQRNHRWEILFRIGQSVAPPPIPRFHSEDLRDFTIQCLRLNPDDRPTSENLMHHRLMI